MPLFTKSAFNVIQIISSNLTRLHVSYFYVFCDLIYVVKSKTQLKISILQNSLFSKIRATSRSARNLISFANIALLVEDANEFSPYFKDRTHEVVLTNPDTYKVGDVIYTVKAYDNDGDIFEVENLSYKVIGPFKDQ